MLIISRATRGEREEGKKEGSPKKDIPGFHK